MQETKVPCKKLAAPSASFPPASRRTGHRRRFIEGKKPSSKTWARSCSEKIRSNTTRWSHRWSWDFHRGTDPWGFQFSLIWDHLITNISLICTNSALCSPLPAPHRGLNYTQSNTAIGNRLTALQLLCALPFLAPLTQLHSPFTVHTSSMEICRHVSQWFFKNNSVLSGDVQYLSAAWRWLRAHQPNPISASHQQPVARQSSRNAQGLW